MRIRHSFLLLFAVAMVFLSQNIVAWGAPITFNTALPVAKDEFLIRQQFILGQSGKDFTAAERDVSTQSVVSILAYGINSDLALFAALPYVNKTLKLTMNSARLTRSTRGFGDMTFFGRYTIYKNNFKGGNFRIAPFAGIKMPTGNSRNRDSFGQLPASLQPGSGSWDPLGGIVMTYQTLSMQVDTQISYKANMTANGFEAGDVSRMDSSLQYRLWPKSLSGGVPGFLYGVLEMNLIHQGKNKINAVKDLNSGGTRLFLVPGIQYVTRRWIAEISVQLPIIQDMNGTGLENDYIARTGFRFNF
ncbi:MAG: transporter [Alphaproteobacteria bacterium]|nr:transporter [Alphaproteobacteria bacterium]